MALSLHAEYLLGFLAGARAMASSDAAHLGLVGGPDANQSRALLRALALGVADARRGRALREAPEVRMHVLTLLSRESSTVAKLKATEAADDPSHGIEDLVREALDIA